MSKNANNRPLTATRSKVSRVETNHYGGLTKTKSVVSQEFGSLVEFLDEMKAESPENARFLERVGHYSDFEEVLDYTSRKTLLESLRRGYATKEGWEYYANEKSKVLADPSNVAKLGNIGQDTRRKRRRDLAGCIVNIDKAMVGVDPMESYKRNNRQKSVRIFIDYAQSCSVPSERIFETATRAIAICKTLEKKGYSTEIAFGTTSEFNSDQRRNSDFEHFPEGSFLGVTKFIAKPSGVPLNETKLVNYCSSGIFRDLIFQYWRDCLGFGGGLGRPFYVDHNVERNIDVLKQMTKSDVYVGKTDHFDDILTNVLGHIQD